MKTYISEVNLANIKESPIISESEVLRRINMVERSDQREEVERIGVKLITLGSLPNHFWSTLSTGSGKN